MSQLPSPQSWQSPMSADGQPSVKRQRLSPQPNDAHPPATPLYPNLPQGAFANTRPHIAMASPLNSSMGPPVRLMNNSNSANSANNRNAERPLDIHELNDLVASSGVNLKEEEDFLNASFRFRPNNPSSQSRQASQPTTPHTSFDLLQNNEFGHLGAARSSFRAPQPQISEQEELFRKHKQAARALSESQAHTLQNPFFWGASMRKRMQTIAQDNGIQIPITGLWDRISDKPESMGGSRFKDAQNNGIQVTKAPSMLNAGSPLEPLLSLLSLAGNDRIRSLLEDAYGLARGRRSESDGKLPEEWSDGTAVTPDQNGINDQRPQHKSCDISRDHLQVALATLSKRDREAESLRLQRREARTKKKAQQGILTGDAADAAALLARQTAAPTLGEKAPEVKMTKKEREKAARQDLSEEVAAREANATATMQIGGKQYSWMSGGSKAKALPKPLATPTQKVNGAPSVRDGSSGVRDRSFGQFREDGVGGKGVQLRDWVTVLEQDGHERRTLLQAYLRLDAGLRQAADQS